MPLYLITAYTTYAIYYTQLLHTIGIKGCTTCYFQTFFSISTNLTDFVTHRNHSKFKRFNPFHAKFLKWNNPPSIHETFHYHI